MGGAKNCPETPRQKMIGMMYLVLTAMLALNVSADIINGYAAVDTSLHLTMDMIEDDNNWYFGQFARSMAQNPEKTRQWADRGTLVRQQSDSLYNIVQAMKDRMVEMADGAGAVKNATVAQMNKKDDTNIPHQFGLYEGNGAKLKVLLEEYREFLATQTDNDPKIYEALAKTFCVKDTVLPDGELVKWEDFIFNEMPVCASLTMLTKIQNDIRTEEHAVLDWLFDMVDAGDLRVNKMNAYVIPRSDYVIEGGKYSARIIMAAIDSTQRPDYYINGQKLEGDGLYEVVARGIGEHKFKGQIAFKGQSGQMETLDFESAYMVGEPTVTVSNTEMDIMYRGYDNKFSISVPGVASEKVKVEVQGASTTRKGALWIIKPADKVKEVTVTVRAELDGKLQTMGTQKYRVKSLPQPSLYFMTGTSAEAGGQIAKTYLRKPEAYFELSYGEDGVMKCPYTVKSFETYINNKFYQQKSGTKFTSEMLSVIGNMKSGQQITVMNVKMAGPDGKETPMKGTMTFIIK